MWCGRMKKVNPYSPYLVLANSDEICKCVTHNPITHSF